MKPWLKILIWVGLGGGIGFFAGLGVGARMNSSKTAGNAPVSSSGEERTPDPEQAYNEAVDAYRGDTDGDEVNPMDMNMTELHRALEIDSDRNVSVDIVDKVPPVAPIPQLHPEDIAPYMVTEDEFNRNEWDHEIKCLDYYEEDETLYDPERDETIPASESLLGIGWDLGFGGDPNNPTEVIYICNDTMGTLYRVELVHAAFNTAIPGDDDETDEDFDLEEENW